MKILGISAFYHDSAAAIVQNGKVIAAAQEERFSRKKNDDSFPLSAIKFCLKYSDFSLDELDAVVFYDKPLLTFERLLETYYGFAPKGLKSFITSMPIWLKEKIFLNKLIKDELSLIEPFDKKELKNLCLEHHLSHAASAFYPSPFEEAAILTIDGVGEWATASLAYGSKNKIRICKELRFPHSLGLLYSAFTYYLGFKVNSGEYKLMGLAPYGDPQSGQVQEFINIIKKELIDIKEDGSIWMNQKYFDYAAGLRMVNDKKWEQLFGFQKKEPDSDLLQHHCNLGLAIQNITEEIVIKMAKEVKKLTNAKYLCMAGGVALNCVANGKILNEKIFDDIFIQPAAGDAGGAVGAALAAYHVYYGKERILDNKNDSMSGSFLGPEFAEIDILQTAKKFKAKYSYYDEFDELTKRVASLIDEGKVIGWFQGRMEYGPRALGNRSILGDARNGEMQKKLNLKIKYRESFRPFAPSVLNEDCKKYFELEGNSPYMLLVQQVKKERCNKLPGNYHSLPIKEKLYFLRSDLPAVTHIDLSARVQTVHKESNKRYWQLLNAFKQKTGYGVVVNTSFNVRGEPIVCSPEDAYRCFMKTEMDYLIMGDFLFDKKQQTECVDLDQW